MNPRDAESTVSRSADERPELPRTIQAALALLFIDAAGGLVWSVATFPGPAAAVFLFWLGGALTSIRGLIWRRRWGWIFSAGFLATSAAIVCLPYLVMLIHPGFGSGMGSEDWMFLGVGTGFVAALVFLAAGRRAYLSLAGD